MVFDGLSGRFGSACYSWMLIFCIPVDLRPLIEGVVVKFIDRYFYGLRFRSNVERAWGEVAAFIVLTGIQ